MKKLSEMKLLPDSQALQGGSYSLTVTAIVLAIVIVLNILVSSLPGTVTRFDISSSKLYSITSNTKAVVNNLAEDVTIYWIVQADREDDVIENLLEQYDSMSGYVTVLKKNPDVFPTFTQQYTEESVPNNSLIVEAGARSRYISYNDIYLVESDPYSYSYTTSFDGEGAITSAIDYVTSDDLPTVYVLQGHGEADLPASFREQLEKENIQLESLSLLVADEFPEDADLIMIYGPESDLSAEEAQKLTDYAEAGGKLLIMAGPTENGILTNLYGILENYGVTACDGLVVEGNREYYAFGYPYILMPDMQSHEITEELIGKRYYVILPLALGMRVSDSASNVTPLLSTSYDAFSKADGFEITTYEREEDDLDGPFTVGLTVQTRQEGQIAWFSSSDFLGDMYNAYSSGANGDLAMNAISWLMGEREAIAIRSKSLNYNYLTISDSTASTLKLLLIGVFPLSFLLCGVAVVTIRKKVSNEPV